MRYTKILVAAAASVALASGAAIAATGPAHAAKATGSITMTLKPGLAYVITGDHWVGVKPARTGIEPAGTPFPGPTVTFPVSFEDGAFKVRGKGELALGPGSISAHKPLVSATPDQLARGKAQMSFVVGNGFPTFLGAPLAMNTADLKAGKVDAALVGLTVDDNPVPGARYAANEMRTLRDWMSFPPGGTDQYLGVDWGSLRVADYGNIASYANQDERSLEEIHKVISEILAADTIPIGVGGTHIQSYSYVTALARKYGPGQIMLVHVDAHVDTYVADLGRTVHNGSFLRVAVDKGILKGDDLVQVGLRGQGPGDANLAWLRENKVRTHFQAEADTLGWETALKRILSEVKGRMVYLSFDIDAISPAYAPGVGTQDPDGMTAAQALQLVRALAINSEIVAADFIEYNPLMDDAYQTTGILVDRLIRSLLAGLAARRQGITDPLYIDPRRLDYQA